MNAEASPTRPESALRAHSEKSKAVGCHPCLIAVAVSVDKVLNISAVINERFNSILDKVSRKNLFSLEFAFVFH